MPTAQKMTENKLEQRLKGAYIELDSLLGARFLAKELQLHQRRKALSLLAGPNKTNFRGRGIDFEEVRAYQAGDDIRTIDWRVTARSGKTYTKLFQEERERPLLLMTDQRQAMFFGSQYCFKSAMACYLSALIAWSGINNGDRVGGLVFGNNGQREVKPRRSRQSALALMHLMLEYNQSLTQTTELSLSPAQHMEQSLVELRRIAKPGSAIYIISDFAGYNEDTVNPGSSVNQGDASGSGRKTVDNVNRTNAASTASNVNTANNVKKHMYQLSRHCEITAIYVYDQLERQLPPPGQYTITDGKNRNLIYTGNKALREDYSKHFTNKLTKLQQQLGMLGIPVIEIGTDQPPLQRLLHYYGTRR